jgi:hypothetical protein
VTIQRQTGLYPSVDKINTPQSLQINNDQKIKLHTGLLEFDVALLLFIYRIRLFHTRNGKMLHFIKVSATFTAGFKYASYKNQHRVCVSKYYCFSTHKTFGKTQKHNL